MSENLVDALVGTMLEIAEQILKVARAVDRQQVLEMLLETRREGRRF